MVDPKTVLQNLEELRALTADEQGAQRLAWSPIWLKARAWFEERLKSLPVEHHYDAAGNRWITLPGKSDKALVIGSHLDSVPNGGWLDGCLGVLAGLEVLTSLANEYNGKAPCTVRLVDWADEEGARFGRSLFGSSAFAGTHTVNADRVRTDRDGTTLEVALRNCGIDVERIGGASREQKNIAAYLELHIEQGPILERRGLPLGVVEGTKGVERHVLTFTGQEAHAGATPMNVRRDALAAAAKLALQIRAIAKKHPDAVSTAGSLKTFPGIATAIVGRCEMTLDQRDLDPHVLTTMLREAREASERFAAEEGCTVDWSRLWGIEPVAFDPHLLELCEQSVKEIAGASHRLPAGALHDAAEVARAGIPSVMMFVQSVRGISHNKIEDTREEHLELAVAAFDRLASKTIDWILAIPSKP